MQSRIKLLIVSALTTSLLSPVQNASAIGLMKSYEDAMKNDPTYRSAVFANDAGKENAEIGRSNLLPTLSFNYASSKNQVDRETITTPGKPPYIDHPEYTSKSSVLNFRQPIISLDGMARYRQGVAQANNSQAQFAGQSQDLALRVVGAYLDALFAEDQFALANAQRDTLIEQRKVNDRMYKAGEGTKTDMLETQAKLDLAEAQLIESRDNLLVMRNTLSSIVGSDVTQLDHLAVNFSVQLMQPASYEDWKEIALKNNAEIASQRYTVEAAEAEVSRNRAGHAPKLDMVASYSKSNSDTLNTYNQDINQRSVGVQLSIPLYSGGYVNAASRQAVANRERAKSDMDDKTNKVQVELRKQHSLVLRF